MLLMLMLQAATPSPPASAEAASVEHAPRDWGATLRADAQALHDDIAANHPGPVNTADPGFARRNDAQLALALARARTARGYGDYFFALRGYVASFDDGHLGFGATGATPADGLRWPGFLTAYGTDGVQRVAVRADDAPIPLGAALLGCDGADAEQTAARVLAPQWGRWRLEAQRRRFGANLFNWEGNPYVTRPSVCRFRVDGRTRTVPLDWRPIDIGTAIANDRAARGAASYAFAARTLRDGARWYSMPSFNADPASPAGKALPGMIAGMRAERGAIAAAPRIVLDLRGNGGGSSDWSRQIAQALWGQAALDRLPPDRAYAEWRASPANLRSIRESYDEQRRGAALSPEADRWFRATIACMTDAMARRVALCRAADDDAAPSAKPVAAPLPPLRGRVFLLTDGSCGSACLDAVDLWRALGAVHVGRTTSADTLYMDVRRYTLPSGLAGGAMPMKVYRGRPRGDNQPVVPTYAFAGDIADTAKVEAWIAGLPAGDMATLPLAPPTA